ncbi:MAG: DUF5687 family protein [Rhodothermales bacterium]|nr:DUF5687 family protein [Rhodothermales bacterium]
MFHPAPPTMAVYRHLLAHHWKSFTRSLSRRNRWLTVLAGGMVMLYVTVLLGGMGFFFKEVFRGTPAGIDSVSFLNQHLIEVLLGMFSMRFFLQQGPRMKIRPYLHLPIPRKSLVRFYQLFSLLSFHNVIPYLFVLPFWLRYFIAGGYELRGSLTWLAGFTLFLFLSHFAINLLRTVLSRNSLHFLIAISAMASLLVIDQVIQTHFVSLMSFVLFGQLAAGNLYFLGLIAACTVSIFLYSSAVIRQNLRSTPEANGSPRVLRRAIFFGPKRGQVMNLIMLELRMIWRNKRPKHYFLLSVVFALAYISLMLADTDMFQSEAINAVIGLFASGTFALNYGQLMFAWESIYFDGFLARSIRPEEMVLAKLMILQGSCLLFFLISLPLFIWLNPDLLLLHVTFLFYNAGVTSVLMLALAVRNQHRVDIARSGSFFNYEGFSLSHWLWIVPTVLPPAITLFLLQNIRWTALLFIGGVGVASLVFSRKWSEYFTQQLLSRKYQMAMGFRKYED